MLDQLVAAWVVTSTLEIVSVAFGLAYVVLAARENIWCWPAALVGTSTAVFLFWDASLLMESALNVYYIAMAIFGWWQWQYAGRTTERQNSNKLAITSWGAKQHSIVFALIAVLTLISGYVLSHNSNAAWSYVDSFTTWSAVICTWMVARKILENWLYWIVIDLVSVWLYADRGLYLYSVLFAIYSIVAVAGYRQWRKKFTEVRDDETDQAGSERVN